MGRSRKITDEQILEAAREEFLAEGFGASTVNIAHRAGVSEGSIFKRFGTKERLFFAAMGGLETPSWVQDLESLVGQGDLKLNLITLSLQIIEFLRKLLPRVMMLQSKGEPPPLPPSVGETPFLRDLRALTMFFEAEVRLQRIRPCDPQVAASSLLGMLTNRVLMEQTGDLPVSTEITTTYIQALIEFIWQGMAPDSDRTDGT